MPSIGQVCGWVVGNGCRFGWVAQRKPALLQPGPAHHLQASMPSCDHLQPGPPPPNTCVRMRSRPSSTPLPCPQERQTESGIFLVDRTRHWLAVEWALWLNVITSRTSSLVGGAQGLGCG